MNLFFPHSIFERSLLPLSLDVGVVRDSFVGRSFGLSATGIFFVVLAAIAFLLVVALVIGLMRRRRKYVPYGLVDDPRQMHYILSLALDQRSTFELQFPNENNVRRPILRCSPQTLRGRELVLEAFGIQNVAQGWAERPVEVYFKISSDGQPIYYAARTKIRNVEARGTELCHIVLHELERLENRQKRSFLRINPPEEYLLGAALWYKNLPGDEVLNDATLWPKPDLLILPGKVKQFDLVDISAGGLRLRVPRKEMEEWNEGFAIADPAYFLLSLLDPDERKHLRFWLQCRVQNLSVEYVTRELEVGLQFMAWAMVREGSSVGLEWLKLTRSLEVDPLGNWVIRRHLELFRDGPEAY